MITIKPPSKMVTKRPTVYCKKFLPLLGRSISMLVSQGGTGKSFCSIKIAIIYVLENEGRKAVLWLTEDSEGECYDRYNRLVAEQEKPKDFFNKRISFITSPPQRITKLEDGNAILTKEYLEIKLLLAEHSLIILDPLLQFNGCDENSNTHAGVLMGELKSWANIEDKEILLLHHVTFTNDGSIKARGAGEWQNGCRCVYSIAYPAIDGEAVKDSKERVFELIKDNGIGYRYFTNSEGTKERTLTIFPEEIKVPF